MDSVAAPWLAMHMAGGGVCVSAPPGRSRFEKLWNHRSRFLRGALEAPVSTSVGTRGTDCHRPLGSPSRRHRGGF